MWTRWLCYNDIPAGLRGKCRQTIAARTGVWSTGYSTSSGVEDRKSTGLEAENKELRAKLEYYEKKEGKGTQGGQGLPSRRESGMEEEWRMEVDAEDEIESRKKLDEQKRKLQEELRDVEKLSCIPKEAQDSLKSALQQQLQEAEQKWHGPHARTPESAENIEKDTASRTKEDICRKTVPQRKKRCGSSKRSSSKKRSVTFLLSENSAELQRLHAGEARRGSNASQTIDCCMEALWQKIIAGRSYAPKLQRNGSDPGADARKRRRSVTCARRAQRRRSSE